MSTILWANNATTTLAGAISNTSTTANLATGTGVLFPAPTGSQYFVATLVDAATGLTREIVHVTNVSGDTVTMVRAQEGTTALNWSAGDIFANLVTAGTMQALAQSSGSVASFNTRTGAVTLTSADVTGALTYTPLSLAGGTMTGRLVLEASSSGGAGLNVGQGTSPGSTGNGDVWTTSSAMFVQLGGNTHQLADTASVQTQATISGTDSGTANTYNVAQTPAVSGPQNFQQICLRPAHTNTGASTLALNSGTAEPIKKLNAGAYADVAAGDLTAGHSYWVVYDNPNSVWQLMSPVG